MESPLKIPRPKVGPPSKDEATKGKPLDQRPHEMTKRLNKLLPAKLRTVSHIRGLGSKNLDALYEASGLGVRPRELMKARKLLEERLCVKSQRGSAGEEDQTSSEEEEVVVVEPTTRKRTPKQPRPAPPGQPPPVRVPTTLLRLRGPSHWWLRWRNCHLRSLRCRQPPMQRGPATTSKMRSPPARARRRDRIRPT